MHESLRALLMDAFKRYRPKGCIGMRSVQYMHELMGSIRTTPAYILDKKGILTSEHMRRICHGWDLYDITASSTINFNNQWRGLDVKKFILEGFK